MIGSRRSAAATARKAAQRTGAAEARALERQDLDNAQSRYWPETVRTRRV